MKFQPTTRHLVAFAFFAAAIIYAGISFLLEPDIRPYMWTIAFIVMFAGILVVLRKFPGIR